MKTGKTYKEAILRAHQSTEEANQTQEKLLAMKQQKKSGAENSADYPQLNESPKNVMKSWHNLRSLDQDLAENYYSDLADDVNKEYKREKRA